MRTGAFGVNCSCMNGPVPSPFSRSVSPVAPSGTMLVNLLVMSTGSSTTGFFVLKITVVASGARDAVRIEEFEHGAGAGAGLLVEQALEAVDHVGGGEVLAAEWNFTPSRSLNVQVRPSSDTDHSVASSGRTLKLSSMSTSRL